MRRTYVFRHDAHDEKMLDAFARAHFPGRRICVDDVLIGDRLLPCLLRFDPEYVIVPLSDRLPQYRHDNAFLAYRTLSRFDIITLDALTAEDLRFAEPALLRAVRQARNELCMTRYSFA